MNEDAVARFDCLGVGCARMVEEARTVPAAAAIDHPAVGETKHERMPGLGSLTGGGASPAGHFTLVLDEPLAGGDRLQRKESLPCTEERRAVMRRSRIMSFPFRNVCRLS